MKKLYIILLIIIFFLTLGGVSFSCTNFLITKSATKDGSTMITYAADSHTLYGYLHYAPERYFRKGEKLKVFDWDSGKFLGKIAQVTHTIKVIGNMNEYQVAIGETTFGGRKELRNPKGIMDYGSLIYIALERAKTAREAIEIMVSLTEKYGYYSSGESFSVADPNEVWILEMIGKGPNVKGTIWVARKIPDGYVSAHANYPRITNIPFNDKKNTMYAKDIVEFARKKGYFKGKDKDFSFRDAYSPPGFGGLRFCEARVWQFFRRVAPSKKIPIEWVKGDLKTYKPLPLWIKPDKKLSVLDLMDLMRDHFEGTEFDLSKGVGAGPYHLPYRWRPLVWKHNGKKYFNERSVSTQQTGFSFIAQMRSWLPNPIGGILWFGVDDTASTVYIPIYAGIKRIPKAFAKETADFYHFSWDSAFWVFNFVSNFTYLRYEDMIKDVQEVQRNLEGKFVADVKRVDQTALHLYKNSPELARDYLTEYSIKQTQLVMKRWKKLLTDLLVKYMDGNVKDEHGKVTHPGYPKEWYERIIKESGEKYRYIEKKKKN